LAGIIGGCEAISPIVEAGDSVIRVSQNVNQDVIFPLAEELTQTITESVTVLVT